MNNSDTHVQVQYPSSPHGDDQSDFNLNSNNGASGTAWIQNNVLLFEIENARGDPDECTVTVSDYYGNNAFSATGTVQWQAGDTSVQYIEFSDFPLQSDQALQTDQCDYAMSVMNMTDNNSGTEVGVKIYRG